MAQGVNSLIGSTDSVVAVGGERALAPASDEGAVEDGVEFYVAALVIGALALLILFRVGGFQAVIATR